MIVEQADQVTAFGILGMHSNPERIVLDHTAGDVVLHVVVLALLEVKLGEHGAAVEDMNMQNLGNVLVIIGGEVDLLVQLDHIELLCVDQVIHGEALSVEEEDTVVPVGPELDAEFAGALWGSELLLGQVGHAEEGEKGDEAELVGSGVPRGAQIARAGRCEAEAFGYSFGWKCFNSWVENSWVQTSLFTGFFIPLILFERVEKKILQSSILPRLNSNKMYKM